jgi:hypothetical protein
MLGVYAGGTRIKMIIREGFFSLKEAAAEIGITAVALRQWLNKTGFRPLIVESDSALLTWQFTNADIERMRTEMDKENPVRAK